MTPQNHLIKFFQEVFPESDTDFCPAIKLHLSELLSRAKSTKDLQQEHVREALCGWQRRHFLQDHIPAPKPQGKQESLHLQDNPQSQLCVINMLKHMADRSNAWRFEILNSLCKTQGSFKFLMRGDRVGTAPRACGAGGLVNSSLHCAGQGEIPVPTQTQLEPQCARAQSSHSP